LEGYYPKRGDSAKIEGVADPCECWVEGKTW